MTSKSNLAVWTRVGLVACLAVLVSIASLSFGQQLTGTLSGTTMDSTGAVVANAKVTMKNEASGDTRTTVSNGSGYFSITAVQPGTYMVTVSAPGFKNWAQSGIVFAQGDNRTLSQIALQVGAVNETVEIQAGALSVPTDNAEVSTTLNQTLVQDVPILGRDAGELLKLMPGMAAVNGTNQGSTFTDKTVGTNSGPVGAYSSNGTQPNGSMAYMLDGANLVDPGNAGSQLANINQDMVSEVKVLMSSYSAEYAKGPVIFQAFSKSGGSQYHGEGYMYARNQLFNSWDAYSHSQYINALSNPQSSPKKQLISQLNPDQSYYYMGGNVGGPIIPHHNKLFFWGGYEYMRQHPAGSITNYNVPTVEQKAGDFSETTINGVAGTTAVSGCGTATTLFGCVNSPSLWQYAYNVPWGLPGGGTQLPQTKWDPNIVGIATSSSYLKQKYYPDSNIAPNAGNGWNNYTFVNTAPQNRWEATGKVDYAINESTKLTGSYSRQIEADQHPISIWWEPAWNLPYPSPIVANTTSQAIMTNFTHVFNPTTTNEFVFTYAKYINPSGLGNPKAVDRSALGFNVQGLFGHTTSQIPNFLAPWGGAFPQLATVSFTAGFGHGQTFGAEKKDPSIYDNFTKVIGSHTLKFGAYWDTNGNVQSQGDQQHSDNGAYQLGWGPNSSGNVVADWLLGSTGGYIQSNKQPQSEVKNHQYSIYAQDSYKANRQLTLNYGLRADHIGQWFGPSNGAQVWCGSCYVNGTATNPIPMTAGVPTNPNTGFLWHAIDSKIPQSGFVSPMFYYQPRVGLAYDVFGTGKTVIRSGFAMFRYQFSINDVNGAFNGASGIFNYNSPGTLQFDPTNPTTTGYAQASTFVPPSAVFENGATGGISVMERGDNRTPYVMDWNVTISQALPVRSVLEVSYVANKSRNMLINGGNDKINDINGVSPFSYFGPDPVNGLYLSPSAPTCNSTSNGNALDCSKPGPNGVNRSTNYLWTANNGRWYDAYRPMTQYGDVYLITHGSYANYNSLQVSWQKQSGPITFLTNYTFSKVLGTRDGQTDQGGSTGKLVDPFNLKNNYGPLAYDHTQIANFSVVWNVPKFIHGSKFVEGAVNGWQLTTYTTYQSGAPIQPNMGGNLNLQASGLTYPTTGAPDLPDNTITLPNGLKSTQINSGTWFGTDQNGGGYTQIIPQVTCDPRKHASGAYFNPNCFALPSLGHQGTLIWPYIKAPGYFDSDLGLFKSFQITERQKIQFRLSAINWLNHALPQFGLAGNSDQSLSFTQNYPVVLNDVTATNGGSSDPLGQCHAVGQVAVGGTCTTTATRLSTTNTNGLLTGKPKFKTGSRQLTFALKYYF